MRTTNSLRQLLSVLIAIVAVYGLYVNRATSGAVPRSLASTLHAQHDSTDVVLPEDDEAEIVDDEVNVDPYRGRSNWTPDEFGRLADSMGIDNRRGQSAAVAHILASMKQGNLDVARKRLRTLLSTPGYMLDPDLAQVLVALDMVLGNQKSYANAADESQLIRDTVYLIDTVYKEAAAAADESNDPQRVSTELVPMRDTVYVDVVKYDTVYIDRNSDTTPQIQTGPTTPDERPKPTMTEPRQMAAADTMTSKRIAVMAEEIAMLKRDLERAKSVTVPTTVTRQCFTILVASFADRGVAESEVKRLKRRYRRARLAISESETMPFSVIVGYYQTVEAARVDARMVSAAVGKRCRAVATTIAEKL